MNSRRLIVAPTPEDKDQPFYRFGMGDWKRLSMSALGQKQTYAAQQVMSSLPPNSDRESGIPHKMMSYPRKQTCAVQYRMSAKGQ